MYITDKDLPLKAIVYFYEGKGYIDGYKCKIKDYDLSPQAIIKQLDLLKPNYAERAKWGHHSNA